MFAGGGCRCFWQAGFWAEAGPALGPPPARVAGVSAGSAFACAVFAGVIDRVLEDFCARVRANERNVYPARALRGRAPFPHEAIYRATILASIDRPALARLHAGPDIRVPLGRAPRWCGSAGAIALGLVVFLAEQRARGRVHAVWGRRLGFEMEVGSVRDCPTPEALADLILHSSCTPPITPAYRRGSRLVFDGGIVDHVPTDAVEPARRSLVLLTKHHPREWLPEVPGRTYVQPSEPVPVAKWDYTSPERVRLTYDLGRRDGERFARSHQDTVAA